MTFNDWWKQNRSKYRDTCKKHAAKEIWEVAQLSIETSTIDDLKQKLGCESKKAMSFMTAVDQAVSALRVHRTLNKDVCWAYTLLDRLWNGEPVAWEKRRED